MKQKTILERFKDAQAELVIQSSDFSLETISRMVSDGIIDPRPGYQRRERWDRSKQSALIESFLLNVPVPPIYLSEDEYGTYSVIDGQQRIAAVHAYLSDTFPLTKLVSFPEINGIRFSQLPRDLQNALIVRPYVRAITLLRQSDPDLKYEVFLRLNTGGESLNPQEIRNVAYRGPLNDLVLELAGHPLLRKQLKIHDERSAAYRKMLDAELVLRFLMLEQEWQAFSGDFRVSMNKFMQRNQRISEREIAKWRRMTNHTLNICEKLWGEHAFKRPAYKGWRDQFLAGLYDAQMIAASMLEEPEVTALVERSNEIPAATKRLFKDHQYEQAVRQATNTPARVDYRVRATLNMLRRLAD
jgi:hypothetical protein